GPDHSEPLPARAESVNRARTIAAPSTAYTTRPTDGAGPHHSDQSAAHHTTAATTQMTSATLIARRELLPNRATAPVARPSIGTIGGNTAKNEPPADATPRPPRNRLYTGQQ